MEIDVKIHGNQILFSVAGKLDIKTSLDFNTFIEHNVTGDAQDVVVDFSNLRYIDSSGLGAVIKAFNHVTGMNGKFCVTNPDSSIREILQISGVTSYLEVLTQEEFKKRYPSLG